MKDTRVVGLDGLLLCGGDWRDTDKKKGGAEEGKGGIILKLCGGGDRRVKDEQL